MALFAAWAGVSVWQNRSDLRARADRALLAAAAAFLVLALLLPEKHTNTIQFASRWVAPGLVLLMLSLPSPTIRAPFRSLVPAASLAVYALSTSLAWITFERTELTGLQAALDHLPPAPRVLGLDFVKKSEIVSGRPFLQTFAYAQVLRGGELNFSFADFGPSLVVYREPRHPGWTQGLEWYPERVQDSDFRWFDHVIASGDERIHERLSRHRLLSAVTHDGIWRLYRVEGRE